MSRFHRLRSVLDGVAAVATIVAAAAIVAVAVPIIRGGPRAGSGPDPALSAVNLPDAPIDVTGAAQLGEASAAVGVLAFSDFECPYCERFYASVWPQLKDAFIEPGKLRFVFKHLPLANHRSALAAAIAAECAGEQGQFWAAHDLWFDNQSRLADLVGAGLGARLKVDQRRFEECIAGDGVTRVKANQAEAARLGVTGTPTFLIGRFDEQGRLAVVNALVGAQPFETFKAAVERIVK